MGRLATTAASVFELTSGSRNERQKEKVEARPRRPVSVLLSSGNSVDRGRRDDGDEIQ